MSKGVLNIMKVFSRFDINSRHKYTGTVMRTPSYGGHGVLWGYDDVFDEGTISDIVVYAIFGIYLCFEI